MPLILNSGQSTELSTVVRAVGLPYVKGKYKLTDITSNVNYSQCRACMDVHKAMDPNIRS